MSTPFVCNLCHVARWAEERAIVRVNVCVACWPTRTSVAVQRCTRCRSVVHSVLVARELCRTCHLVPERWSASNRLCLCGWRFRPQHVRQRACGEATCDARPESSRAKRERAARRRGTHTSQQWANLVAQYGGRCHYCGEQKRLTKDHVRPISRGGSDLIDNIVPACGPCNSSKGTGAWPSRVTVKAAP